MSLHFLRHDEIGDRPMDRAAHRLDRSPAIGAVRDEVFRLEMCRELAKGAGAVASALSSGDGLAAGIGRDDVDRLLIEEALLGERDGETHRLLTRTTSRAPDAQRTIRVREEVCR